MLCFIKPKRAERTGWKETKIRDPDKQIVNDTTGTDICTGRFYEHIYLFLYLVLAGGRNCIKLIHDIL